jgi:hypothetical protein
MRASSKPYDKKKVFPVVQVILSYEELDITDPGY